MSETKASWNGARFVPGTRAGHYESWFQRANHPTLPRAFWIRYTIFAPAKKPDQAEGELWGVYFDGATKSICAAKQELPIGQCAFAPSGLKANIGDSTLDKTSLRGAIPGTKHRLEWSLDYTSPTEPLLLLSDKLYKAKIPKAKALIGSPNAVYSGSLKIDGEEIPIDGWVGSQNHNWGSKHTDRYAWGQVAGFDDEPDTFFEVGTGRLKIGPLWTPHMTIMALRLDGREHRLSTIQQSLKASGSYDYFNWTFASATEDVSIEGTLSADADDFVGLPYRNPPGGVKTCLNSKIARCEITVRETGKAPRTLTSKQRAAFEILTEDGLHGVPVMTITKGVGGLGRGEFA